MTRKDPRSLDALSSHTPARADYTQPVDNELRSAAPCERTEAGRLLFRDEACIGVAKKICGEACSVPNLVCMAQTVQEIKNDGAEALGAITVRGGLEIERSIGLSKLGK